MERNKKVIKRQKEQGFVFVIAVIVMVSLFLLVTPFLFQLSNDSKKIRISFSAAMAV